MTQEFPIELWVRQVLSIVKLELRKNFFRRRGAWVWLLAAAPVLLMAAHAVAAAHGAWTCTIGKDTLLFAGIYQLFILRLAIFFGCVGIFANLFRGDVLDRSLHYYFLAPVRRDVLLAGKYAAGLVAAFLFFGGSTALSFLLVYAQFGLPAMQDFVFAGPGLGHLAAYLGVTALACAGYGAVFLMMGLLFRNPMIPAAAVLVWESVNVFLPALLQQASIIYYLKNLCPVEIPLRGGLAAILSVIPDPAPAGLAVAGLLSVSALILWVAARRVARMEISYSAD